MRRVAGIVALLLLLSGAAPVLACMTTSAMNHEESACCRAMHGKCGDMTKMGCCRTEVRSDTDPQIPTAAPSLHLHWVVISWLVPGITPQALAGSVLRTSTGHSPPGLPSAIITVLRI